MSDLIPQLQSKNLRRANTAEEYSLYRAALEWDLIDPILIKDRKDLKSEHKWRDRLEPFHHQVNNLIAFCRRLPVTLLADDVGLGKTISAGLVMSELMTRGRISKTLIVCPKLLMPQWQEELETKFGIPSVIAVGKDLPKAKPPEEGGAVITTYHSARAYLDAISGVGFEMLILDEAHKLRNLYGVEHAPQVAQRFRQALADRMFKYVLMLTATPIQNRLWDVYSLIDLLTVARGHENPFGNEGMFARTFIADNRSQARRLNPAKRDEFRSIVYGYMSRVRRGDVNLHFPDRIIQLHKVAPTAEELELIDLISKPIQKLNRLAQISILQALLSSPHALAAQLNGMALRGTIPASLAADVQEVVDRATLTAKLRGLGTLVVKLSAEQPEDWRMVVFTTRRETQTTIEAFLEERGISCGLINGESAERNKDTIAKFRKIVPEIHVIVSTEAGSEGINLQAANVLVNYDLPWNPMVVEQRIGRIQRLASEHASVCIFNIILRGTFEEYIVGRLMEKLQLAAHAIGDMEALLGASGLGEQEENGSDRFEEQIRQLVIASLAGKDVESATRKAETSIAEAKAELEREEQNINSMLGGMDTATGVEIPFPRFPDATHVMPADAFVLAALAHLGARVIPKSPGLYAVELDEKRELIRLDDTIANGAGAILYMAGTSPFGRLVSRITGEDLHLMEDGDDKPAIRAQVMAEEWVRGFEGNYQSSQVQNVERSFSGVVLVRARATVAHDSYERLIGVSCLPDEHWSESGLTGIDPIPTIVSDLESIGVDPVHILERAKADQGIAEFSRFYEARRTQEVDAAERDPRKKKKVEDDFTPRLELLLVGLEGTVCRRVTMQVTYDLEPGAKYSSGLVVIPSAHRIDSVPDWGRCSKTGRVVPRDCLERCAITRTEVLRHLLVRSESSGRSALPEHTLTCAVSGRRILSDEAERSALSGQLVSKDVLKTSAVSGKRAEPQFFGRCEFTGSEALQSELVVSKVSGKRFRSDQQLRSIVSGKTGHQEEFIYCAETNHPLLPNEAEKCDVTGKVVVPGLLEQCAVSGKRVLPSELERSAASGKKALRRFFVSSSVTGARILESEALRSMTGKYCAPQEAKTCLWSGTLCHPEDLKTCELTGVMTHLRYLRTNGQARLEPLLDLLNGICRKQDKIELWPVIRTKIAELVGIHSRIETAESSPDGKHLAICVEVKDWLGLRTRHAGLLYSTEENIVVGRVVRGKRETSGWILEKVF